MTHLKNPHAGAQFVGRIMADIDLPCYSYFFGRPVTKAAPDAGSGVLVGTRGARQAIMSQMFEKLKAACLAEGIDQEWQPENEEKVQAILDRMNFKEQKQKKKKP